MKHATILDRIVRHGAPALVLLLATSPAVRADVLKVPSQFPTIQEAVDAAASGDVVLVKSGTYLETVIIDQSGVTLRGKGATIDARYEDPCIEIFKDDVTLDGLTLANGVNGVYASADRTVVTRCTILAPADKGMELFGDDVVVSRCTIMGASDEAILYRSDSSSSSSRFEKNAIVFTRSAPLDLEGGHLSITQNRIAAAGSAVYLTPTHLTDTSVFSRNDLELIDDYGLYVDITDAAGMLIEKNVIRGVESEGMYVFLDSAGALVLYRNTIEDTASSGIEIRATASPGVVVEKNQVRSSNGPGICVDSDAQVMILDNDITDTTEEGIYANLYGDPGVIDGNRVRNSGRAGIRVVADGGTAITNNDIRLAAHDGIRVDGDFLDVSGNKVVKNLGDGIEVGSGAFNDVTDNVTSSNFHEGIDNSGMNTTIDDNVAKKNGGPDIAGTGKDGNGSVTSFSGNVFGTGGEDTEQVYGPPN